MNPCVMAEESVGRFHVREEEGGRNGVCDGEMLCICVTPQDILRKAY